MRTRWIILSILLFWMCPAAMAVTPNEAAPVRHLWGDVDQDGLRDLFVLDRQGNKLFRNLGQGGVEDVTALFFVKGAGRGSIGFFGDYDRDGSLDLFLFHEEGFSLYRNEAGLRFSDVTKSSGLDQAMTGSEARLEDIDRDGFEDLLVRTPFTDRIFHNRKGLDFEEVKLPGIGEATEGAGGQVIPQYPLESDVNSGNGSSEKDDEKQPAEEVPSKGMNKKKQPGGRLEEDRDRGPSGLGSRERWLPSSGAGLSTNQGEAWPPHSMPGNNAQGTPRPTNTPTLTDQDWNYWSNAPHMFAIPTGNVGIGTDDPNADLEVRDTAFSSLRIASDDNEESSLRFCEMGGSSGTLPYGFEFLLDGAADRLHLWSRQYAGNEAIRTTWYKNGNIGMGPTSPVERLDLRDDNGYGALRLGNTSGANAGTIRWTGSDFEGYDGTAWQSLAGGGGSLWSLNGSQIYYNDGKVGIGASTTGAKLHVYDDATTTGDVANFFRNVDDGNKVDVYIGKGTGTGKAGVIQMWPNGAQPNDSSMRLGIWGDSIDNGNGLVIKKGCKVGIGELNPATKLHVDGGSDASVNGGGYLVIGDTDSYNLVLDTDEIMARYSAGIPLPLWINDQGGDVVIGEHGDARLGIGVYPPTNPLHVHANGTGAGGKVTEDEVVARFRNKNTSEHTAVSIDGASNRDAILYLAENGTA